MKVAATEDIRLVQLAQLYLYANAKDWSYGHLMADHRAREVKEQEPGPLWMENDMAPAPSWMAGMKGLPSTAWASLHLKKCGIDFDFFDIGANLGIEGIAQATLHKRCGWTNKVYLFEPGRIYSLIEQSIKQNRISDIAEVFNAAVSNEDGRATFYYLPEASGGSSLLAEKLSDPALRDQSTEIMVKTVILDEFIRDHARPTPGVIVKIDTEGADIKVLAGMTETIRTKYVIAQIEFIPGLIENYASPNVELLKLNKEFVLVDVGHERPRGVITGQDVEDFVETARQASIPPDIFMISRRLPDAMSLLEQILAG